MRQEFPLKIATKTKYTGHFIIVLTATSQAPLAGIPGLAMRQKPLIPRKKLSSLCRELLRSSGRIRLTGVPQ